MFHKKYFNQVITFTLLCLSSEVYSSIKTLYTKTDLEILQGQKSYQEFLAHAKDIPPRERDKSWYEMLSDMGSGLIDNLRKTEKYQRSTFKRIEELASWPEFKRDEFFQVKREAYTLSYLKHCLTKARPRDCREDLLSFWKSSRKDNETGYQLMLLNLGFFPKTSSYPFIEKTLTSETSHFYCARPMVQSTVYKHLRESDIRFNLENANQNKKDLQLETFANQKCWQKLIPFFKERLFSQSSPMDFYLLEHLGELSELDKSLWLTLYFLNSPEPGPLFNRAWNTIEKVSQSYHLRGKVFKKLTQLDPLPGKIFAHPSHTHRKTLTDHLAKNFPEYVAKYSKQCISYLSGEKIFPHGNPTMECHELFSLDQNKEKATEKIISQELHLKYSGIQRKLKN